MSVLLPKSFNMSDKQATDSTQKPQLIQLGWLFVSSTLILLIGCCVFYFLSPSEQEKNVANSMVFNDNLEDKSEWMLATRNSKTTAEASFLEIREGIEYYQNKAYDKAIPIFQDYLENNAAASDYNTIEFYLAVSYLGQGETERSTVLLEKISRSDNKTLKEDAIWHLSLAYARIGDVDAAKEQMELLVDSKKYAAHVHKLLHPSKTNVAIN